ncbi:MAG TPA: DUF3696 domain-containing protein [Oculatellaceae cyanobacterium]|jgi:predicted ATPase
MLKSLILENFKPFENQSFSFKTLTLLSGLNSSGKSSLLQSLLLLRQSYQQDLLDTVGLALNGDLVCIGTAQDALFERANKDLIVFEIVAEDDIKNRWVFDYDRESNIIKLSSSSNVCKNIYNSSLFSDKFHYLRADRISPSNYFEISDFQVKQHQQIGTKGEFTAHFLSIYDETIISNKNLSHPSENSLKFQNQVEAWLGEISPGTRIELESHLGMDLVNLKYSYGLSNSYRSTNVGFGITYTLPIIVAILSATSDTLILLENPEAHLHPKGQSKMGELIALAASCGIQIVVETHSDHILNAMRIAVKKKKISPEDVQIYYFEKNENREQPLINILVPQIHEDGNFSSLPPDGFFDEFYKTEAELI